MILSSIMMVSFLHIVGDWEFENRTRFISSAEEVNCMHNFITLCVIRSINIVVDCFCLVL